jgi:hypothetical protein
LLLAPQEDVYDLSDSKLWAIDDYRYWVEPRETGPEYGTGIRDQNTVPETGPDPMRDVPLVLMSVIRIM